ncbi:CCA tRNA nucleotidyltransferase [candidate division WOR-3 bacterium]|nr:CCA tRNA nucleotidyltransferase [candidate division WOR-3 bacterium]
MRDRFEQLLKPWLPYLPDSEIYLVGGTVRDILMGREPNDFDFVVIKQDAASVAREFAHRIRGVVVELDPTRNEYRVVKQPYTFDFVGADNLYEDLKRRDFTVNAIAYSVRERKLIDIVGGVRDIESKLLRAVREVNLRDDPLRILRAFRLQAEYGFRFEERLPKLLRKYRELLNNVARERIGEEMRRILAASAGKVIRKMAEYEVLDVVLPEIKPMRRLPHFKFPVGSLLEHSLWTLEEVERYQPTREWEAKYLDEKLWLVKLAGLLHDVAKPQTLREEGDEVHFYGHDIIGARIIKKKTKEELRLSNDETKVVSTIVRLHMRPHLLMGEPVLTRHAMWRLIRDSETNIVGVMVVAYADGIASGGRQIDKLKRVRDAVYDLYEELQKPKLPRLVTGYDLIDMGLKPGPIFKEILGEVEELQVEGIITTREQALKYIKKKVDELKSSGRV